MTILSLALATGALAWAVRAVLRIAELQAQVDALEQRIDAELANLRSDDRKARGWSV